MAKRVPCVLIGWDGATFDLVLPWVKEGKLPNIGALMARGSWRILRSVIPPVTPAAWASILTGMNPGKHGILDFKEINPSDYVPGQSTLTNSTHFAGTTILDLLGERGLTVCALQLPMTYPVWPVKGVMLAGIPNPDDSQSYAYPPGRDFGPLRPNKIRRKMSHAELMENCTYHIEKLTDIYCDVIREDFDFYTVYYRESDDFHHRFWRLLGPHCHGYDPQSAAELGNPILEIYQLMDKALGRVVAASPEANFFLISDHGGTQGPWRRFNMNTWLEQRGYIKLKRSARGALDRAAYRTYRTLVRPLLRDQFRKNIAMDNPGLVRKFAKMSSNTNAVAWPKSRAFSIVMSPPTTAGIQLNVRGREHEGSIEPGAEYERTRDQLMEELKTIRYPDDGKPAVLEVRRREEVVSGPHQHKLPDILIQFDPRVMVRADLGRHEWGEVSGEDYRKFNGDHDMNGIFISAGVDLRAAGRLAEATLLDVAPTLLCSVRQPVPENMDGRVLEEVFQTAFLAAHPPSRGDMRELVVQTGENVFSAEEEEAVRNRLQDLGYLGE